MKTQSKAHPKRKELLLADLIGDKKAQQLIESVRTYEGWKSSMQLDGAEESPVMDALEIKNAYKKFSRAPHIQAELQLNKILELKRLVTSWIITHTLRKRNVSHLPRLRTMLALQEHLTRRQHQIEAHLEKKQQEHDRERRLKLAQLIFDELSDIFEPSKRH